MTVYIKTGHGYVWHVLASPSKLEPYSPTNNRRAQTLCGRQITAHWDVTNPKGLRLCDDCLL